MTRIKILIVFLVLSILSCNKIKTEYYQDGSIKKNYRVLNGKLNGTYKEYFRSGNLKLTHKFFNGKKVDTSFYYLNTTESKIGNIVCHLNDSLSYNIFYDKFQNIITEGRSHNDKYRLGKWKFYKRDFDSLVEYKNINNQSYTNQIWVINKNNDTLATSNYFHINFGNKDTLNLGDHLRIEMFLFEPFFNYNTDVEMLIPYCNDSLNHDFSNFDNIKLDTIKSMKNDGISNRGIPEGTPINHMVNFEIVYESTGKKEIRGAIVEYLINKSGNRIGRRLFFEKEIFIVD